MVFHKTLKEWSEASTIHGVRYVCEDEKNIIRRFLWFVVVCFSAALAIHMSVSICNGWKEQVKFGKLLPYKFPTK